MAGENKIELIEPPQQGFRSGWLDRVTDHATPGDEVDGGFGDRWKVVQKRRWTILTVLLGIFTIVLFATMKEKPVYQARGLMEIEQENPNVVTVQDLFQIENVSDNYLETQYQILRSDTLAREIIQQLRLDQITEFNLPKRIWPWERNQDAAAGDGAALPTDPAHEQAVLRQFEERLSVNPVERSRLVRVSFDSEDPKLAADVVNSLAAGYIQQNLQMHWEATQRASAWLSQQLDGLKIKLEKSEDELQTYVQANGLLFLANDKGQTENIVEERLRELQEELTQAQGNLYQKEPLFRLVEAGDYGSLPGMTDDKVVQDLTDRLADLERQRAELSPDFKPGYPKMKQIQSEIDRVEQLLQAERVEAAKQISNEYLAAVRREALVHQAFENQQKEANAIAEKSVQYNILKREVESNQQLYEGLLQRLKEAGISAGLKASNIRIVDAAVPPTSPVKPRIAFNLGIGLFLGLACGLALAFVQERLDDTLKSADDVEHFLRFPALAMIPSIRSFGHARNGHSAVLPDQSPSTAPSLLDDGGLELKETEAECRWIRLDSKALEHSTLSEAIRSLRTSVLLSSAGRPPRSLAFISAEPGEGKTTICCNLAISLAQLGKHVLVVDADLRQPRIHEFFQTCAEEGLVNYLTGAEDWQRLVQPTTTKNLDCLVCGPVPPNPSELLSSERMQMLIREAMTNYNFVLVDSPPLLNVTDGRILASVAEGTILTVRGGATPRELVRRAQIHVSSVGGHLIGVVLNDVELGRNGNSYAGEYSPRKHRGSAGPRVRQG
ncbi:MAG TPA: polysaccharide biosynthesis tyrosine autokinase [Candidatus Acidoferrales bacterium]|nr:polysaccharide biosynthesis tyrosine autokinase [Candidatus Acidoferrales bacterium]